MTRLGFTWRQFLLGSVIAMSLCCNTSRADIIYSTFGPGDTYDEFTGWVVANDTNFWGFQNVAMKFTPDHDYRFDSARVAFFGNDGFITMHLMSDNNGLPGSIIESFTFDTIFGGPFSLIFTMNSVTHPLLEGGQTYWLATEAPPGPDYLLAWCMSTTTNGNFGVSHDQNQSWLNDNSNNPLGAFDINGTSVPAPSATTLVILGAVSLLGFRAIRSKPV